MPNFTTQDIADFHLAKYAEERGERNARSGVKYSFTGSDGNKNTKFTKFHKIDLETGRVQGGTYNYTSEKGVKVELKKFTLIEDSGVDYDFAESRLIQFYAKNPKAFNALGVKRYSENNQNAGKVKNASVVNRKLIRQFKDLFDGAQDRLPKKWIKTVDHNKFCMAVEAYAAYRKDLTSDQKSIIIQRHDEILMRLLSQATDRKSFEAGLRRIDERATLNDQRLAVVTEQLDEFGHWKGDVDGRLAAVESGVATNASNIAVNGSNIAMNASDIVDLQKNTRNALADIANLGKQNRLLQKQIAEMRVGKNSNIVVDLTDTTPPMAEAVSTAPTTEDVPHLLANLLDDEYLEKKLGLLQKAFETPNEELVIKPSLGWSLYGLDFQTLKEKTWLNGVVVNAFFQVLSSAPPPESEGRLPCHSFSSFFFSFFMDKKGNYTYDRVKPWVAFGDIFEDLGYLFFPVNKNDEHWALIVADMKKQKITCYDSAKKAEGNDEFIKAVLSFLEYEHQEKRGEPLPKIWQQTTDTYNDETLPRQENGDDCGVFVCLFAYRLLMGYDLTGFDQNSVDKWQFRKRIGLAILVGLAN